MSRGLSRTVTRRSSREMGHRNESRSRKGFDLHNLPWTILVFTENQLFFALQEKNKRFDTRYFSIAGIGYYFR
jgi:hypothetical protein